MIPLLDTNHLDQAEIEIGCRVEQLLTPITRFSRQRSKDHYAIDNGAFSGFEPRAFQSLLSRESTAVHLCRFVAVPDVVASARRTLEVFEYWRDRLNPWPLALVAQDGQEDLDIPWNAIAAIFIGGSTHFKLSKAAKDIVMTARAIGKWCHVGRVNTPGRFEYFEEMGADSIDGTGLARFSWMRERIYFAATQPKLPLSEGTDHRTIEVIYEPRRRDETQTDESEDPDG